MTIHLPVVTTGTKSTLKPRPASGTLEITQVQYKELFAAVTEDRGYYIRAFVTWLEKLGYDPYSFLGDETKLVVID